MKRRFQFEILENRNLMAIDVSTSLILEPCAGFPSVPAAIVTTPEISPTITNQSIKPVPAVSAVNPSPSNINVNVENQNNKLVNAEVVLNNIHFSQMNIDYISPGPTCYVIDPDPTNTPVYGVDPQTGVKLVALPIREYWQKDPVTNLPSLGSGHSDQKYAGQILHRLPAEAPAGYSGILSKQVGAGSASNMQLWAIRTLAQFEEMRACSKPIIIPVEATSLVAEIVKQPTIESQVYVPKTPVHIVPDSTTLRKYDVNGHVLSFDLIAIGSDKLELQIDGHQDKISIPHGFMGSTEISNIKMDGDHFTFDLVDSDDISRYTDYFYTGPEAELDLMRNSLRVTTGHWTTDGTQAGTKLLDTTTVRPNLGLNLLDILGSPLARVENGYAFLVSAYHPDSHSFANAFTSEIWLIKPQTPNEHDVLATDVTKASSVNETEIVFSQGGQLWGTDGTLSGTTQLTNLHSQSITQRFTSDTVSLIPQVSTFFTAQGKVYFTVVYDDGTRNENSGGNDGPSQTELWITDGTISGTVLLKPIFYSDVWWGGGAVALQELADTTLFLVGVDWQPGTSSVWKTDGTPAGTVYIGTVETDYTVDFSVQQEKRLSRLRDLIVKPELLNNNFQNVQE